MTANRRIYFDHNATSPIRPMAADAMLRAMNLVGNASSVHSEGRAARDVIENAREQVAALVRVRIRDVYFTSGGTEANNTILSPRLRIGARQETPKALFVSATEHPSVLGGHQFKADEVRILPVESSGLLDLEALDKALAQASGPVMVSVHVANSETGIIQPIRLIADCVHRHGGILHADAVQAAGRMELDVASLGVDILTLSAHKIGGPKGAGAIVIGQIGLDLAGGLIKGGGQERGNRSGTENIAAIAGFGCAAEECRKQISSEPARLSALRNQLEVAIVRYHNEAVIIGTQTERLCNTLSVAFPNQHAETLLIAFDLAGFAVSSGSACSSGKVKRSHVLEAMGMNKSLAEGAIRLSLGWSTTQEDCFFFEKACKTVLDSLY